MPHASGLSFADHLEQIWARAASGAYVVLGLVAELVAPSGCAACDASVAPNVVFCPACSISLVGVAIRTNDRIDAAFEYGGAMATAIGRLKYEDRPDLAPRLGALMKEAGEACVRAAAVDCIVPVPLHPKRLAERGYNHAALLATALGRALALPVVTRAVVRVRDTPRQAMLDREHRLVNVRDAFAPGIVTRATDGVAGARILLVDDVRTTGATLDACARALAMAGACSVTSLVLARRA